MHTFLAFFAWPDGTAWSNVIAMPVCGLIAGVAAFIFRDHIGRAVSGWWHRHFGHGDALDAIQAQLDGHAVALDLSTPGGLAAVVAEVREAKAAAQSAQAAVEALAALYAKPPTRRAKTLVTQPAKEERP